MALANLNFVNSEATSVFSPIKINRLEIRNRIIKTATYEGRCKDSGPTPELTEWHRRIAQGGVGMTTLAYCAVHKDARTFLPQMYMRPQILPALRNFTDAMHNEGAAVSIQLAHCGYFTKNPTMHGRRPLGPSFVLNKYGLLSGMPFGYAMTRDHIQAVVHQFGQAAAMAREAKFDAVEIHCGHGYLLSQFLSPAVNHRRDDYGGSLFNRSRFSVEVAQEVRKRVGPDFPILAKMNLSDGFRGGLELQEAVEFARLMEHAGIDALILTGGFTSKTPFYLLRGGRPLKEMVQVEKNWVQKAAVGLLGSFIVKKYPFKELFFEDMALEVKRAVQIPVALVGGVLSKAGLDKAMKDGFDMVAIGRALIHDPDFVRRIESGEITRSGCTSCNKCIPEMDRKGVVCVDQQPHT